MPIHPGLWYDRGRLYSVLAVLVPLEGHKATVDVDSAVPGHGALFLQERILGAI